MEETTAPTPVQMPTPDKSIHGGRNLMILGAGAAVIAFIATAVSLHIYRTTGDVYLDRSRPGYIFENERHDASDDKKDLFANEGEINVEVLDGYIKALDETTDIIEESSDDFSLEPLSDKSFNIVPPKK